MFRQPYHFRRASLLRPNHLSNLRNNHVWSVPDTIHMHPCTASCCFIVILQLPREHQFQFLVRYHTICTVIICRVSITEKLLQSKRLWIKLHLCIRVGVQLLVVLVLAMCSTERLSWVVRKIHLLHNLRIYWRLVMIEGRKGCSRCLLLYIRVWR